MACARVSTCPLFKQFTINASLKVWQCFYCDGGEARCERFKLFSSGQPIPPNLLPNGKLLDVPLDKLEPIHLI